MNLRHVGIYVFAVILSIVWQKILTIVAFVLTFAPLGDFNTPLFISILIVGNLLLLVFLLMMSPFKRTLVHRMLFALASVLISIILLFTGRLGVF